MPSGSVEKQHGVGAVGDVTRDFVEVKLHRLGVGMGQGERRAEAPRRADGAEQIGVVIALISRLVGPRSASRPLPDLAIRLADASLVLKPYLDRRRFGDALEMSLQRAREILWNGPPLLPAS